MTVGSALRAARERAGLSAKQIGERTKIQLYKIEAIEDDDFDRLPQGIYLDGIVRAYAQEVGMDQEPMVERLRRQRGKRPGDWQVPFAVPIDLHGASVRGDGTPDTDDIPILDLHHRNAPLSEFTAESDLAAAPIPRSELRAPATPHAVQLPAPPPRQRAGLVLPLLVLLAAAGLAMYFYESVPPLERVATPATATVEPRPDVKKDMAMADAAPAPREVRPADAPVPFSENVITTPERDPQETLSANSSAVNRDTAGISDLPAPPPERIDTPAPAAPSSDVTGSWTLATHVETSSYSRFAGLKLGYEMQLEQEGDRVTGTGRKVMENGEGIGPRAQTPVTVSGKIDGDRLTLNFVERGVRRPTQGKFVLLVDDAGTLRGRFSSDAARSSGRVEAHRVATR